MTRLPDELKSELMQIIYQLDSLCAPSHTLYDPPSVESVILLGRRLAPSSVPPLFMRFNGESGPLEPLPSRYHIPFPTLEDLRFSVLNFPGPNPALKKLEEDEYADEF
jgi:hypothetical protein